MSKSERRSFTAEIRAAQGALFAITGIAARYNVESNNLGGFTEIIAPGAFTETLSSDKSVVFTKNHDLNQVLARTDNGSLRLWETPEGLCFLAMLNPEMPSAQDFYAAVQSGLYDECSFAFRANEGGERWNGTVRTLLSVTLEDVSVVARPAYPETNAQARNAGTSDAAARLVKLDNDYKYMGAPTTAELKKRLAKIEAGEKRDGMDDWYGAFRSKEELMDAIQQLYASENPDTAERFRVVDVLRECESSPGKQSDRFSCTAILRNMDAEDEEFWAIDVEDDPDTDEKNAKRAQSIPYTGIWKERAMELAEVSALRLCSKLRKVTPSGTSWTHTQRALTAENEWQQKKSDRELKRRMASA